MPEKKKRAPQARHDPLPIFDFRVSIPFLLINAKDAFALTELTHAEEAKIAALVKKAVS